MPAGNYRPTPQVTEIVRRWDSAKSQHQDFVRKYDRNERSYKGILTAASDAARWRHKLAPPYAHNLIETVVSNTIEMGLKFDVRPSPHVNVSLQEAQQMLQEAESVSDLLRHEHRVDEMDFKQRPLYLTSAICGRGIGKAGWAYSTGPVRRQAVVMQDVKDEDDNVVLSVPTLKRIEEQGVLRDHSTCEVVDPRDFVVPAMARSLQPWQQGGAPYLFERCWYTYEQLEAMERGGDVKNVAALKETQDFTGEYADREKMLWDEYRKKDMVEVLVYWCMEDGIVTRTMLGNRIILLRDTEDSPFDHGNYPYFVCSSMPQPFQIGGTSEIELIEALQSILWEMGNQTLDNVELINNFITLIRSDVDDPDAFEHYPGARWPVDSVDQVSALQPPYQLADVALKHMSLIKGDLQNVTSAAPFASGAESATVDQKTATGASIVMSAAQQRLLSKKYQAQQGLRQEANMRIKNCQQFIDSKRLVHIVGEDGAMRFREIEPYTLQGEFLAELEPMSDSIMRQEKRAEAMQWMTTLVQAAPMFAAAGTPLNMRELFAWAAKKWDIMDWERFLSQQPQSMGAAGAAGPGGGGQRPPQPPGQPNMGITSDTAVDASSPSTTGGGSLSGMQMLQRASALGGG